MWSAFKDIVFVVIEFFYNLVGDWGLAIIIVTLIFRAVMTPLMFKQSKSSRQMQKIQPKLNKIKETFADDPVRQNQEMQRLYAEAKFNPLAGCVPMLIQMPIFIALFQVLREMAERTTGTAYTFYSVIPDLTLTPKLALAEGFGTFVPYLILLVVFAGATFLPMIMQQAGQQGAQRNQMLIMAAIMSLMMLWVGWSSPGGVLLFWGASSILAIAQQQGSLFILKRREAKEEEETIDIKPVEINVTRKVQKKRQSKKR